ncbi:unnamed protein product [Rotaria sordida]|uniref:C-type lectin domain-containing protein n=1 Tax=Rotaria sordida TaxID=392033 RepID=A0A814UKR1_9BILA|nr:unnamed protein product [Rotaria sordida]
MDFDALHRYGTVIYVDSSIRFNSNSFNPVVIDNYIRGFAVREIPDRYLSCYTHTDTFTWFNQSYTNFDNIYIADSGLIIVSDTFITRLIMKAWLTCALEPECNKEAWGDKKFNDPAPYDMFINKFGFINVLKYLVYGKNLSLFNDYCNEKIKCTLPNMICKENKCKCIITRTQVYFWTGKRCIECIQGWTSFSGTRCFRFFNENKTSFDARIHCHKYKADLVYFNKWPLSVLDFVDNITKSYFKSANSLINIWATANSNLFNNDKSSWFTEFTFQYLYTWFIQIFLSSAYY